MSQRKGDGKVKSAGGSILKQSDLLVPMLPFGVKKRGVQEHKVRNPHRRHFHEDLEGVEAAWVGEEVGVLEKKIHEQVQVEIGTEGVAFEEGAGKVDDESKAVNVRLFMVCGINAQEGKHVLRRLDVIGASIPLDSRTLTTYGGLTTPGPDQHLISSLISIVKSQSGLDLSTVKTWTKLGHLTYTNKPDTVVFFPHLWGVANLEVRPQIKVTTEEYEEEQEQTVPLTEDELEERRKEREEAADEEMDTGDNPTTKTVKKVVTKTRETEVKTIQPTKFAMGTLLEYNLAMNTSNETVELCTAVDLFDEWLKRDFASKIATFLDSKQADAKKKIEETARQKEEEESRKRKRGEQEEECRKKKVAKIGELREAWESEDIGKTDEDKKESDKERKEILAQLDREEQAELNQLLPPLAKRSSEAKKQGARVQPLFDSFQYFDRPRGLASSSTTLSRGWLAQQLLCLDEQRTYGDCLELVTLNGLYTKTQPLDFDKMAAEEVADVEMTE